LPEDYSNKIKEIPGVREVMPIQVWTNNCRASLDIVVFNGVSPAQIQKIRPIKLISGNWQQFASQSDAAIVGRNIASRRGLKIGHQFSIGDISVKVAGIFESKVPSEENLIYTHLAFLQFTRGLDAAGLVTQHEVLLTDDAEPDRVATEIDATLRAGAVATKTRRKGAFQASTLSDLVDLIGFAHWLGFACVALVLSLVATTTVIIGVRPMRTMRLVLAESTTLCLIGGAFGTTMALGALGLGGFAIGAEGATIAFRPSWALASSGMFVSLIVGIAAGIAPAIQAATVPIVDALRRT
jgi:putative ABC transport system permease protein